MKKSSFYTAAAIVLSCSYMQAATVASFTASTTSGCSPLVVSFTNNSSGASNYHWDFGDGNSSVMMNPSNVYSQPGTYTVKLIISGSGGNKDSMVINNLITVVNDPLAEFTVSAPSLCLNGNQFIFTNQSLNANSWIWDFGDGNTSTLQNPTHSYGTAGSYTVKLIAKNNYGCSNVKTKTQYIIVTADPVAALTANITSACNTSHQFVFNNSSSGASSYIWNFGDGNISTQANPTHSYSSAGLYSVTLIASNAQGCSHALTKSNYITIHGSQVLDFTADKKNGCTPLNVLFTDTSKNAVSWLWNFGDNTSSTVQNPLHTYQNVNSFNVSLTITTAAGCTYSVTKKQYIKTEKPPLPLFTASATRGCAPLKVNFKDKSRNTASKIWLFGDGTTSTAKNPSHTYTKAGIYYVMLKAYNSNNCEVIYKLPVPIIVDSASAAFTAASLSGCNPHTVNFTDHSLSATQWYWDFGDGNASTLQHPSHTYFNTGSYNISLISTNSRGCKDTLLRNSYIDVINLNTNFTTPPPVNACAPFTTSLSDATPGVISWQWDFGDGTTSLLQQPLHTYINAGTYTVSLTVKTSGGCIQTYNPFRIFKVEDISPGFTFTLNPCPGYKALFNDTTPGAVGWLWKFGDGKTSTQKNPTHIYSGPGSYIVSLTITSSGGCKKTVFLNNAITFSPCGGSSSGPPIGGGGGSGGNPSPVPAPKIVACLPLRITFNNTVNGAISWTWNFGNGGTSNKENPTYTYTTPGIYTIILLAKQASGKTDTVKYINYVKTIHTKANFGITQSYNCIAGQVMLTDSSVNTSSWLWDFGDGNSSVLQNPSHSYSGTSQNFTIRLTAADTLGCSDALSKSLLVNNNIIAWANFYNTCINQSISFTCQTPGYNGYHWDFGDGTNSTQQNTSHIYTRGGTYTVTLKVTDGKGCVYTHTFPKQIVVDEPIADFNYTPSGACNSLTIAFNNNSTGINSPSSTSYKWDFGDGSPAQWSANPTHVYSSAGAYSVTLFAYTNNTCFNSITKNVDVKLLTGNFSFIQNRFCFPMSVAFTDQSLNAVSWLWDFGDGNTSMQKNPGHVFVSMPANGISLTVTDSNGCSSKLSQVSLKIISADANASTTSGCSPLSVSFTDKSSNAKSWQWNFGDGSTSTMQHPIHSFINNGIYTVTLMVHDSSGCRDTAVFGPITSQNPVADFSSSLSITCAPSVISFKNLCSYDAASWAWDFGDGSSSTAKEPSHVYNTPGPYSIKLIATNSLGCKDSITRVNYVKIRGSIAAFTVSANQACPGSNIYFTDNSVNANNWNWNFGDGNISNLKNPVHAYQNSGQYSISLIVSDSTGCSSNITLQNLITIYPAPVADFSIPDSSGCTPFAASFNNTSQQASAFSWNFGNGNTSTVQNPTETYSLSGNYNVNVIATNQFGCSDTSESKTVTAEMVPIANFYSSIRYGCEPLAFIFADSSMQTSNPAYNWNLGNNTFSNQQNPAIIYNQYGTYDVSLVITNSNGCADSITKKGYITVFDLAPPPASKILTVTVSSDTSVYIVWEPSKSKDFAYYTIYRQDQTGSFKPIGTIDNPNNSSFYDKGLNTLHNSYCYKIQTTDVCRSQMHIDSLKSHCTMNITATDAEKHINVSWTPYKGATVDKYKVYRVVKGQAQPDLVAEVPSSILKITDTTAFCPIEYSYRVKATKLNGNFITSNSDTTMVKHKSSILTEQKVEVVRSTVVNDSCILTEWKAPEIGLEKVEGYDIYRSTDNIKFILVASVPVAAAAYIDNKVDINNQKYYYKVEALNSCNVKGKAGKGSSILLKADYIDSQVVLEWSAYEGWDTGVDYYVIEKQNGSGEWEVVKIVDGNTFMIKD